jgi:hypothetical protein
VDRGDLEGWIQFQGTESGSRGWNVDVAELKTGTRTASTPVSGLLNTPIEPDTRALVMSRPAELATHLQSQRNDAERATKREIVRTLVQRIEIGQQRSRLSSVYRRGRTPELWNRLW